MMRRKKIDEKKSIGEGSEQISLSHTDTNIRNMRLCFYRNEEIKVKPDVTLSFFAVCVTQRKLSLALFQPTPSPIYHSNHILLVP